MEAAIPSAVECGEPLPTSLRELEHGQDATGGFEHPTAEEVTRVTFGKSRDYRITQVGFNYFARLLNRGSSQE